MWPDLAVPVGDPPELPEESEEAEEFRAVFRQMQADEIQISCGNFGEKMQKVSTNPIRLYDARGHGTCCFFVGHPKDHSVISPSLS